jgi:hypothetical protein
MVSCNKKDITKNVTVSGNVRNNCTGKGFVGVTVNFKTTHEKAFGKTVSSSQTVVTDSDGDFSFNNIDIYGSSKYNYYISIPTYSNHDFEFFGISSQKLNKSEMTTPYQIGVSATFKLLYFFLPNGVTINSPDSFSIKLQQRIYHSFEPNNS